MKRPPESLPDPWLLDSESILKQLDFCRQQILRIPAATHEAHLASNVAIDAIWNLQQDLRFVLKLRREAQVSFAKKAQTMMATPTAKKNVKRAVNA